MKQFLVGVLMFGFLFMVVPQALCEGMSPNEFEKKVEAFADSVVDGKQFDYIEAKRSLLSDLYGTIYENDFYSKFEAIVRYSRALGFDIEKKLATSDSKQEFRDAITRYAEWNDFCRLADRASSDFTRGYIKEIFTDKERQTELPFQIAAAQWAPEEFSSEKIDAYLKAAGEAEKLVDTALSALKRKDEDAFATLFSERLQLLRRAEPEYSEINKIFKRELETYWQENMEAEIAPLFLRNDLEEAAKLFEQEGLVRIVIRRWDKGDARFAAIALHKPDGKKLEVRDWAKGFDMQNRRR